MGMVMTSSFDVLFLLFLYTKYTASWFCSIETHRITIFGISLCSTNIQWVHGETANNPKLMIKVSYDFRRVFFYLTIRCFRTILIPHKKKVVISVEYVDTIGMCVYLFVRRLFWVNECKRCKACMILFFVLDIDIATSFSLAWCFKQHWLHHK